MDSPERKHLLNETERERLAKESSIMLRLRQLGDAGLRAAMGVLKSDKPN